MTNTEQVSEIKHALSKRSSIAPENVSAGALREAGCLDRVCVLPSDLNDRLSYLGDVLVQAVTRHPTDDNLRRVIGQIAQTMSYTLNSASWRDGELHDFDMDEIRRKLAFLKGA